MRRMTIGELRRHDAPVTLVPYDVAWPALFAREAERIRGALADRALLVEHAGSTAVPGLTAKPIVDIVLAVADATDEPSYVPALETAGYTFRIREPGWSEHRMFKGPDTDVNLHVFTTGCEEIERMLRFRDRLRTSTADRERYAAVKRALAEQRWQYVQHYADAKSAVVAEILARAATS